MSNEIARHRHALRIGLLLILTAPSFNCRSGKSVPPAASRLSGDDAAIASMGAGGDTANVPRPALAAGRSRGGRHAILGRVVDFHDMRAVATLADTPEEELTDPSTDTAVLLSADASLSGFRLSSGQALWTSKTDGPCRHLALAGRRVYSACGDALYSIATDSGEQRIVDVGPVAGDPVVVDSGEAVASVHGDGRVSVYSADVGRKVASRNLLEFARAMHPRIMAAPGDGGVCVLGLGKKSGRLSYRAGCYDRALEPIWTKWLPLKLTPDVQFGVVQLGPRFLVLDDQESVLDPSLPSGPGNGWLLRWKDGSLRPFDDGIFATVESANGTRLTPSPNFFSQTAQFDSVASNGAPFQRRQAEVVSTHDRAYAIVVNHAAGLGGVDTGTGQTLFLVPIRLGDIWSLEVADGYPVVRTRFANSWIATIHDPVTGAVVYRDERTRTPRN